MNIERRSNPAATFRTDSQPCGGARGKIGRFNGEGSLAVAKLARDWIAPSKAPETSATAVRFSIVSRKRSADSTTNSDTFGHRNFDGLPRHVANAIRSPAVVIFCDVADAGLADIVINRHRFVIAAGCVAVGTATAAGRDGRSCDGQTADDGGCSNDATDVCGVHNS